MLDCKLCTFMFIYSHPDSFCAQETHGEGRRVSHISRDAQEWHSSTRTAGNVPPSHTRDTCPYTHTHVLCFDFLCVFSTCRGWILHQSVYCRCLVSDPCPPPRCRPWTTAPRRPLHTPCCPCWTAQRRSPWTRRLTPPSHLSRSRRKARRMNSIMKKTKRKDWTEFLHLPPQQWLCSQGEGVRRRDAVPVWTPLRRPRRRRLSSDLEPWSSRFHPSRAEPATMSWTSNSSRRRASPGPSREWEGLHQARRSSFPVTYVERDSDFRAFCPFTRALTVWTETGEHQLCIGQESPQRP